MSNPKIRPPGPLVIKFGDESAKAIGPAIGPSKAQIINPTRSRFIRQRLPMNVLLRLLNSAKGEIQSPGKAEVSADMIVETAIANSRRPKIRVSTIRP